MVARPRVCEAGTVNSIQIADETYVAADGARVGAAIADPSNWRRWWPDLRLQTVEDRVPTLITRQNGEACVLMSLEEYNALEETAYLLRSPANARRLMDSIDSLKRGQGVERDIAE